MSFGVFFSSQAHLLSVFDNIKTVTFHEKEYDKILAINSREPETIEVWVCETFIHTPLSLSLFLFLSLQLENPIMAQGNVEIWLGSLLTASLNAVKFVIKQASVAIGDPNFALMEYLNNFPAQVIMHSILR